MARGQRLRELLKQPQSSPLSLENQVATIYAGTNGYLDKIDVEKVGSFLAGLRDFLSTRKPKFGEEIQSSSAFTDSEEEALKEADSK